MLLLLQGLTLTFKRQVTQLAREPSCSDQAFACQNIKIPNFIWILITGLIFQNRL